MDKKLIEEIKRKREFSCLPDSVVECAAEICSHDIKESRKLLRKYFGVFLTNKVLRGRGSFEEILRQHGSSSKRDYAKFYREIFEDIGGAKSVVDLGAGVNGFSFPFLRGVLGYFSYVGIEACGQLVDQMNDYFKENGFDGKAVCLDLFDVDEILKILKKKERPRVVFMFQIVDALENLKRDFSKEFISKIFEECEVMVITLPTESLGGRKKFDVSRRWLTDFLKENYVIGKDFVRKGERVLVIR
jgi:hypothetical protein